MQATMTRPGLVNQMPTGFGKRLAEVMEEKEMSGYRLAQLIGVSAQAVSKFVNGQADPSWPVAVKIAKALGVPLDELATPDIELPEVDEPKKAGRPKNPTPPTKKPKGKK